MLSRPARTAGLTAHTQNLSLGGVRIAVARYDRRETVNWNASTKKTWPKLVSTPKTQCGNTLPHRTQPRSCVTVAPEPTIYPATSIICSATPTHAKNTRSYVTPTAQPPSPWLIAMHLHHAIKTPMSALDVNGTVREIDVDDVIASALEAPAIEPTGIVADHRCHRGGQGLDPQIPRVSDKIETPPKNYQATTLAIAPLAQLCVLRDRRLSADGSRRWLRVRPRRRL